MTGDRRHRGIVLRPESRALLRDLRPTVLLVLQDVALDAEWRADRLVAATSARLVAEHLALDPGTVASALRVLRERGVVELGQTTGPDGRFGLATYTVRLPAGVETLAPKPAGPCAAEPCAADSDTGSAAVEVGLVLTCPWDGTPSPVIIEPPGDLTGGAALAARVTTPLWSSAGFNSSMQAEIPGEHASPAATSRRPAKVARRPAVTGPVEQGSFDWGRDA